MTDIQTLDSQYMAHTYARAPVTFVRGEGCHLYDEAGKPYIDMGSGIAVSALGYGDEGWVAAVSAQAGQLAHASNLYHTAPQALLAQRLCERTGMKRVFLATPVRRPTNAPSRPRVVTVPSSTAKTCAPSS